MIQGKKVINIKIPQHDNVIIIIINLGDKVIEVIIIQIVGKCSSLLSGFFSVCVCVCMCVRVCV